MINRLALSFLLASFIVGCDEERVTYSPQERLEKFYKDDIPESNLVPFLVAGGSEIIPLLLIEIQDKKMLKRRYAIGAVGELQSKEALSILKKIINDTDEATYIKCDALKAIDIIDPDYLRDLLMRTSSGDKSLQLECAKF